MSVFSSFASSAMGLMSSLASGIVSTMGGALSRVANSVSSITQSIGSKLSNFASNNMDTLSNIVKGTAMVGLGVAGAGALAGAGGAIAGATGLASSSLSFSSIASGLASLIGITSINNLIPQFAKGGVLTTPTIGMIAEYSGATSNPEIISPQNTMRDVFESVLMDNIGNIISAIERNTQATESKSNDIYIDGTKITRKISSIQQSMNKQKSSSLVLV